MTFQSPNRQRKGRWVCGREEGMSYSHSMPLCSLSLSLCLPFLSCFWCLLCLKQKHHSFLQKPKWNWLLTIENNTSCLKTLQFWRPRCFPAFGHLPLVLIHTGWTGTRTKFMAPSQAFQPQTWPIYHLKNKPKILRPVHAAGKLHGYRVSALCFNLLLRKFTFPESI